jgi:hypothetical protein
VVATQAGLERTAALIERHPERFLFGTDEVAPPDAGSYLRVYVQYEPLWRRLAPEVAQKLRTGNYERLFDEARRRVRAWETANLSR